MVREKKKRLIITFETTTAPLKLDIKGKACGIPGRTIPLPSAISAGCGLAWRAELSDRESLMAFMKEQDIRSLKCIDIGEKYVLLQSVCEGAKP